MLSFSRRSVVLNFIRLALLRLVLLVCALLCVLSFVACSAQQAAQAQSAADKASDVASKAAKAAACVADATRPYVGKRLALEDAPKLAEAVKACDPRE
jgi:Na+-transporting methylmalonyl-CoA/oxaloacetate decarboxylase gamma subunit